MIFQALSWWIVKPSKKRQVGMLLMLIVNTNLHSLLPPFAKIIFTSNSYPKIADKTRAMERRMRLVSSDRVIKPEEIIPNFVGISRKRIMLP